MGRAKEIDVRVIPSKIANPFVCKVHYSGKVVQNSQVHFGAFLDGQLHGVMSYGPSFRKDRLVGLVADTKWNEFIELNRMAFDDYLPRNSESFCIAKSLRLLKKNAPQLKWVVSFADGTQCGDGTIYRASNFVLTGITKNSAIMMLPDGSKIATMTLDAHPFSPEALRAKAICHIPADKKCLHREYMRGGARLLDGFMLRYVYFLDKRCRSKLTVPELPFSVIDEVGAGMYKGQNITQAERHAIKTE